MASSSWALFTALLLAALLLQLPWGVPASSSPPTAGEIMSRLHRRISRHPQYRDFYEAYKMTDMPAELFTYLLGGGKFTMFIPNTGAFYRIPEEYRSGDKLKNLIEYNSIKGKELNYNSYKTAKNKSSWPTFYKTTKIVKKGNNKFTCTKSREFRKTPQISKWNIYSGHSVDVHGVTDYWIPADFD